MILVALKNPFLVQKLDATDSLPPGDVPELHAQLLEKCQTVLLQTQQSNQSIGVLVVGETGSGKSHLVAQLRRHLANDPKVVLTAILLRGAFQGRLWRHLRERFVSELLLAYPGEANPRNGLQRILRNRFPKWATDCDSSGGVLGILVGKTKAGDSLRATLDAFAHKFELDYGLQKVLPRLFNPQLVSRAQDWLRGKILNGEDQAALGLPPAFPSEQEQESNARDVMLSLLRLADQTTSLFICFDEVEAIQAGDHDAAAFRQFTTLAADLLAQSGPRVVATFIRPQTQMALEKASEKSNLAKMSQDKTNVPPLMWEQVVRLTTSRLEAQPDCRDARREHPNEQLWPLAHSFVQSLFDQNKRSFTPRHLIRACAVEFQQLQKGPPSNGDGVAAGGKAPTSPVGARKIAATSRKDAEQHGTGLIVLDPIDPPGPIAPPVADEFVRMWERLRKKLLARPQGIAFDSTMAIGIPWLVGLTKTPLVWLQDKDASLGDVNLVFQSKASRSRSRGISFCNHELRLLWRCLDRLLKQWMAAKGKLLHSLVVLRAEAERMTDASQTRLTALTQAGARVIPVAPQQLAELAAFQMMLTAAQGGELTRSGKPVEAVEYDAWAAEVLSPAVKELFALIFER